MLTRYLCEACKIFSALTVKYCNTPLPLGAILRYLERVVFSCLSVYFFRNVGGKANAVHLMTPGAPFYYWGIPVSGMYSHHVIFYMFSEMLMLKADSGHLVAPGTSVMCIGAFQYRERVALRYFLPHILQNIDAKAAAAAADLMTPGASFSG